MSYIIAHITENAIDIIDDENGLNFETGTLTDIIKSGKKDFYYKFIVDECIEDDDDCFQLPNSNRYKINFDSKDFKQKVNDDFLDVNASAKSGVRSNANVTANGVQSNAGVSNPSNTIPDVRKFKKDDTIRMGTETFTITGTGPTEDGGISYTTTIGARNGKEVDKTGEKISENDVLIPTQNQNDTNGPDAKGPTESKLFNFNKRILEELKKKRLEKIKYDTIYSSSIIQKKEVANIIGETVKLYRNQKEIASGIIKNVEKINTNEHIKFIIDKESYKLINNREKMDENKFTYFDSLMFIQPLAAKVDAAKSNEDDAKYEKVTEQTNYYDGKNYSDGIQYYVKDKNGNYTSQKKNIYKVTKSTFGNLTATLIDGNRIDDCNNCYIKKDEKLAAETKQKSEKQLAEEKQKSENQQKLYKLQGDKSKAAAEDAKYEKVTKEINYKDGINYYIKDQNGTYKQENEKILSVKKPLFGSLTAILTNNSKNTNCNNCYIKKDEKIAADAKAAAEKSANIVLTDNPIQINP